MVQVKYFIIIGIAYIGGVVAPVKAYSDFDKTQFNIVLEELESFSSDHEKEASIKHEVDIYTTKKHRRFLSLGEQLTAMGVEVVPHISKYLESSDDAFLRGLLIRSVSRLKGFKVDRFMIQLLLNRADPVNRNTANTHLLACESLRHSLEEHRIQQNISADEDDGFDASMFELTTEQLDNLKEYLNTPSILAGTYIKALTLFENNSFEARYIPALARFRHHFQEPDRGGYDFTGLSAEANASLYFLDAMSLFGKQALPYLQFELNKATESQDEELRTWLIFALADAGNTDIQEDLEEIMLNHEDASLRCVAIGRYASLTGEIGIPSLRRAMKDTAISTTERNDRTGNPIYIVAEQARKALEELGEPAPSLDKLRDSFR